MVEQYGSLGSYGSMTIANRNTFLIDPTGKIAQVWTKVNPQVHAQQVLAVIPTPKTRPDSVKPPTKN